MGAGTGVYDVTLGSPLPLVPPTVAFINQNGDNLDRGACLTVGAGEDAGLSCGDLFTIKSLPAYRTLGKDRSLGLLYNSATSNGLVLVAANVTHPANAPVANMVKAILTVGTAKDSAQFNPISAGFTRQIVLGRGITGLATGVYDAALQVQNVYASGVGDTVLRTTVIVVNRSQSEFGKGWGLMGLEQVITDPVVATRRLWISGDGSARVYHRGVALTSGMLTQSGMGGFSAANSVDGNVVSQGWSTSSATAGSWIQADLGTAQEITTLRMYAENGTMAASYDIQYSDNASSWSTAFGNFKPVSNGWRQVTWHSVGPHRYWRLYLTNTPGTGVSITELSFGEPNTFYGAPGDAPDSLVWNASGTTYTRRLKHGTVVTFDANGRHIRTTNRFGAYTSFGWGSVASQPRLLSIVVPPNDGTIRSYILDWNNSTGLLDSVRDPGNRSLKTVMSSGLLARLTDAAGLTTRYAYSGGLLTKQVYVRKGMKGDSAYTTYSYANNARVTSIGIQTDSAASLFATTTVTPWDEQGLAAAYGSWSTGAVPGAGGFATRVDGPISGLGDAADFWVNRLGQPVVTVQLGLSAKTSIWYDSAQTMPSLVTRVQYPHPTTPSAGGRTVYLSWNPRGNLVQSRDSTCRKLAGCSPAQVDTTTYLYNDPIYAPDSPTRVIDALGRYTTYSYNTLGVVDSIIDARNHRTKFWYQDPGYLRGMVDSIAERDVQTWNRNLTDTGFVTTDQKVRFNYNNDGLVTRSTSPLGVTTSYSVDQFGRTYEGYDPLKTRTRYTFDVLNRVTEMMQDSAPQNHPGNLDPRPASSCDSLQILCTDPTVAPGVGPSLTTSSFYGAAGVDSVKDPRGVARSYIYDARGNLVREKDAFQQNKTIIYNQAGQVIQTLGRTNVSYTHQDTVTYTYDSKGRLTKLAFNKNRATYSGTDTVSRDSTVYVYDQLGNKLSVQNRRGTILRSYYLDGTLKTQTAVYATGRDSASYDYDVTGARSEVRRTWVPSSGTGQTDTFAYSYNSAGDLSSIVATWGSPGPAPTTISFTYDALGRRHRMDYADSAKVHFRYDAIGTLRRQMSVNLPTPSPNTDNLDFTYKADSLDAIGRALRVSWICDAQGAGSPCGGSPSPKVTSSRYNRYGWVASQCCEPGLPIKTFTYDKSGNRTASLQGGGGYNHYYRYAVTPDTSNIMILDSIAGQSNSQKTQMGTNANGARTGEFHGSTIDKYFYYDGLGRITGARDYDFYTAGYIDCNWYNPDGQLFSTCDKEGTFRQVFDGENVASLVDHRWVFLAGPGVDDPIVGLYRWSGGASPNYRVYYYVTDGNGRQQAVGSTDGTLAGDALDDYQDRGGKYAGGTSNSHSFDASRMESPTTAAGISYFRNRAYDQATGRWLQEDPIGVAGGVNLYSYSGNNPVSFSDPFGLKENCDPKPCASVDLVVRTLEDSKGAAVAAGHAFLRVTEANGSIYTYSAGPSGPVYGGASEQVSVAVGDATSGTTLATSGRTSWATSGERAALESGNSHVVMTTNIANVPQSQIGSIYAKLDRFSAGVNAAAIPYRPRSTNSNAFAYSAASFAFGANNPSSSTRGGLPWGSGTNIGVP
jgi:RHS repeat-associated protein